MNKARIASLRCFEVLSESLQHGEVAAQAQGMAGNDAVDPSVRSVVYNQAVFVGGGAAWNTMAAMYRNVSISSPTGLAIPAVTQSMPIELYSVGR